MSSSDSPGIDQFATGLGRKLGLALILGLLSIYALFLYKALAGGRWIIDGSGKVLPVDFLAFWSGGAFVQSVNAAQLYTWFALRDLQTLVLSDGATGYFPWLYPPTFLVPAVVLSTLPYPAAFLMWAGATFTLYASALHMVLRQRWTPLAAAAFPGTIWTFIPGQNGCLSAGLIAAALACLERRPVVAGVCLGLLTFRPQLGLLFPIILVATGRWIVFVSAGLTGLALFGMTSGIFGLEAWFSFFQSLSRTGDLVLGGEHWTGKLLSIYGLVKWFGGSNATAWTIHAAAAAAVALCLIALWRSASSYESKAACLGCGVLIATPYAFPYDMAILAVPLAFLLRAGLERGFLRGELSCTLLAIVALLIWPVAGPLERLLAFCPLCLISWMSWRRAVAELRLHCHAGRYLRDARGAFGGLGRIVRSWGGDHVDTVRFFWRNERGVTAIEYGLIGSLVAVAIIISVGLVGTNLDAIFEYIGPRLTTPS